VTKVVNISVISGTALFFSIFFLSLQGQQKKIERIWSRAIMKYNDSIKEQVTNSFFFLKFGQQWTVCKLLSIFPLIEI